MVRTYLKKRNKPDVPEAVIQEGVRDVQERRLSPRVEAFRYGVTRTALHYRILKISYGDECNRPDVFTSLYTSRQIFSENQELMLVDYVIKCSKMNYGMTYKSIRQLAYDCGRRLQRKFLNSLIENKIAGIDWLQGFMKRHKNLTLRKPENTSLFRATTFNKTKVLEHVKKCSRSSKVDAVILLMDNHESHCTLDSILHARENCITLVTFRPHSFHQL